MKDEIYNLFKKGADKDTDITENLPAQEVDMIMKRFKNDINPNKTNKRKKHKTGITLIIAAASAACIGTTAFAAEKSGVFDKLKNETRTVKNDVGEEFPIEKNDRIDYENIGGVAEILSEPVQAENKNISLSIDSIYCDGQMLVVGITGSLPDNNSNGYGYMDLWNFTLELNGQNHTFSDNEMNQRYGYMTIDDKSENSFTGSIRCMFDYKNKLTETTNVKLNLSDIKCSEKYFSDRTSIGSASIEFTVTPDTSLTKQIGRLYEDDGYTFTVHEITPAIMTATYTYPDEYNIRKIYNADGSIDTDKMTFVYDESGNIVDEYPKYSIMAMVYDEYGNRLERVLDSPVDLGNGIMAETFAVPPTNRVIVKFCNKQESDENGMPVVIKEMPINITEIE